MLQVVHDVDQQKIPVRFVITSAGLVGSDGPLHCGAFDITFLSCLPNMIVMAPSDEDELTCMVATAAKIDDRPVCFRYPRGALVRTNFPICGGSALEVILVYDLLARYFIFFIIIFRSDLNLSLWFLVLLTNKSCIK